MKRLVSNKSVREMYSQKWQNIKSSSDDDLHSATDEATATSHAFSIEISEQEPPTTEHDHGANEDQIPKEKGVLGSRTDRELMYQAAVKGDWVAAEELLRQDSDLASNSITEEGDRALHVATAMKNKDFVERLLERMSEDDNLKSVDGRGYTACCYAAISGEVEIASLFIKKNRNLVTTHDNKDVTPLHKAALRGNREMLSYFLKSTQLGDLPNEEWFDLLLVTIRRKMFDLAVEIVKINGSLATMANKEGTALHFLARQVYLHDFKRRSSNRLARKNFNRLANKLWDLMRLKMKNDSLVDLLKKHHILHDAAKTGHAGIVTMVTRIYPQLIWETDGNGYTIFHIAVKYRQACVLELISQVGVMIDLIAISQDQEGNNILHLAAKLAPPHRMKTAKSTIMLQTELAWFKFMETIVPPSCLETRNKKKLTPRDLFTKEHKSLLECSQMWMKNTADSFMLIATILLTVVSAVAVSVPGGYDDKTGKPLLVEKSGFQFFLGLQVIAVLGSVFSIIMFRSIMASGFAEDDFLFNLPMLMLLGFGALYIALSCTLLSFVISIILANQNIGGFGMVGVAIVVLVYPFWLAMEMRTMRNYRNLIVSNRSNKRTLFS